MNVELKIQALTVFTSKKSSMVKLKDKYHAVKVTLCENESMNCLRRQCVDCRTDNVTFFTPLLKIHDDLLSYTKWERVKKQYKGKDVSQIMPVVKKSNAAAVVLELKTSLKNLQIIYLLQIGNRRSFPILLRTFTRKTVILNMDFSENYSCASQHEVQSAHLDHNQITLHPTVSYYNWPVENCSKTVTEASSS